VAGLATCAGNREKDLQNMSIEELRDLAFRLKKWRKTRGQGLFHAVCQEYEKKREAEAHWFNEFLHASGNGFARQARVLHQAWPPVESEGNRASNQWRKPWPGYFVQGTRRSSRICRT
jgi:hypothetical protein